MSRTWRFAALLAAFALAVAVATACQSETSGPDTGITVREIMNGMEGNPANKYAGKTVTVSADVNRVLGEHAFSIAGTQSGIEPLLVVHDSDVNVNEGNPVQVTGTVRSGFKVAEVEKRRNFEFDRDVLSDYAGAPYLVATSINPTP